MTFSEVRSAEDRRLRAEDATARRDAQTELVRPLVLEAGAGTGKTSTLVARVVVWCLGPGWERALTERRERGLPVDRGVVAARVVAGVEAITFTEAAAAEMARRVGAALAAIAKAADPPSGLDADLLPADAAEREARAEALLSVLDRLSVRTIHSFCHRLLAAHPLEAGLPPSFTVDAHGERAEDAARRLIESQLGVAYCESGDADFLLLADRGIGPAEILAGLTALAAAGVEASDLAQPGFTDASVADELAELRSRAVALLELVEAPLATLRRDGKGKRLVEALRTTVSRLEAWPRAGARGAPASAEGMPGFLAMRDAIVGDFAACDDRLGDFARGRFKRSKLEEEALAAVRGPVQAAADSFRAAFEALQNLDPERYEAARRVLHRLLAELRPMLRRAGIVSFDGVLREAGALLARRPEIARAERRRIDQLLVDELQDTDRVQCEIVRQLALTGPEAERPGLFLVGDPKQSIYGWRRADLRAYEALVREVEAQGGPRRRLCVSFRSLPAVLDEVERLLSPLLRDEPGVQAPFQRLLPREDLPIEAVAGDVIAPVEHWLPCSIGADGTLAESNGRSANRIEARALAADLVALHERDGVGWGRIAILVRSLTDFDVHLAALREAGVPFEVAKDRSYYRRREVIEAAALTRCVVDPHDQIALVAWLRSVSVGLPDAALVPLWLHRFPEEVAALRGPRSAALARLRALVSEIEAEVSAMEGLPALPSGWPVAFEAALVALAEARRSFAEDPSDLFVERLRTLASGEALEAGRFLGRYRAANLDRFFDELADALAAGAEPAAVLRSLRRAVADEQETARPLTTHDGDAVQVLTIHGAKGLEFEHVYCVQLHKVPRPRHLAAADTEAGVLEGRFVGRLLGAPSLGFQRYEALRRARESAEALRLLYVATTRAARRLVVSGLRPWMVTPLSRRFVEASLGARLEARLGGPSDLASTLHALAADPAGRHVDAAGARFVLVERVADAARAPGVAAAPSLPPTAAESLRLERARRAAALRAAVLLRRAPSAEGHEALAEARDAAEPRGDGTSEPFGAPSRDEARALGSAVHRALEGMDFLADPDTALDAARPALVGVLRSLLAAERVGAVLERAEGVLRELFGGGAFDRLQRLAPRIVARELPLLLRSEEDGIPPVFYAGAIDWLYRDPEANDRFVVADWKTDDPAGDRSLAALAAGYSQQGRIYVEAVRKALRLDYEPRFELWFLRAGEVWDASGPTPRRVG